MLEEMTTELSGKEGEAGVAQIFVGAGEDGTRGLGLPSPTGTSILHVKETETTAQANTDQRSLHAGELSAPQRSVPLQKHSAEGWRWEVWRCWCLIAEGKRDNPSTNTEAGGAGAGGSSQVRCVREPLYLALPHEDNQNGSGYTLWMHGFNMVLLPF